MKAPHQQAPCIYTLCKYTYISVWTQGFIGKYSLTPPPFLYTPKSYFIPPSHLGILFFWERVERMRACSHSGSVRCQEGVTRWCRKWRIGLQICPLIMSKTKNSSTCWEKKSRMLSGKGQPIKMRKFCGKWIFPYCEIPFTGPFHIHSQAQFRHVQLRYLVW